MCIISYFAFACQPPFSLSRKFVFQTPAVSRLFLKASPPLSPCRPPFLGALSHPLSTHVPPILPCTSHPFGPTFSLVWSHQNNFLVPHFHPFGPTFYIVWSHIIGGLVPPKVWYCPTLIMQTPRKPGSKPHINASNSTTLVRLNSEWFSMVHHKAPVLRYSQHWQSPKAKSAINALSGKSA